jgi:hypothetical protein
MVRHYNHLQNAGILRRMGSKKQARIFIKKSKVNKFKKLKETGEVLSAFFKILPSTAFL